MGALVSACCAENVFFFFGSFCVFIRFLNFGEYARLVWFLISLWKWWGFCEKSVGGERN